MEIYVAIKTIANFNGQFDDDGNTLYDFHDFNIYVGADETKARSFKLSDFD